MPNHVWSYDFVSSTRPLPSGSSEGPTLPTVGNPGRCDDATRAPAYVRSITGRSSSLWPCVNGSPHSNSQPAPSSTAAPGQTAILLHRDGLPPPISCQSPGAPVHPLIPDDAMSVSNQPASTALNSLGFLKWLCNAGWSRPCVGTVVRHLEPLAIKAGLPEDNLLSRRT
jgi:hypothetical protein